LREHPSKPGALPGRRRRGPLLGAEDAIASLRMDSIISVAADRESERPDQAEPENRADPHRQRSAPGPHARLMTLRLYHHRTINGDRPGLRSCHTHVLNPQYDDAAANVNGGTAMEGAMNLTTNLTAKLATALLIAAGCSFALGAASAATTDDVKWINQCVKDNKGDAAEAIVLKYCTCMDNKMSDSETQSITQWEKTHVTEQKECDKEAGWK
jgi:hypothetical protein